MKGVPILLATICTAVLSGCMTTIGSQDRADVPAFAAPRIAQEMTAELVRYPEASVPTPAGTPIYDAFNVQFQAMQWSVIPYARRELKDEDRQRNYIRIFTQKLGGNETLIQMNTPYFDVNRVYRIDKRRRTAVPVTAATLNLKKR